MKKGLFIFLFLALSFSQTAIASTFILCKSTYALCTTAPCTPIAGKKGWVSCQCDVKTGYSVGMKSCQPVTKLNNKKFIKSRYYPIKSYAKCSNNRPWAWCLDSACIINKNNPNKASCACSIVQGQGDYIIVSKSNSYNSSTCTTGLYSSALVTQSEQITDFLKTQTELRPFAVKVYTK